MTKEGIHVALLGLGTVGAGVYKVTQRQKGEMMQKLNTTLYIDSFDQILEDPKIDIVVELMGGIEPAYTYIRSALEAGKSVVTANKDLIADRGGELLQIAEENHVELRFEAAVAGGIPIISPLKNSLAANEIRRIMGIVNGTTNYILTKMTTEGMDYADALAEATALGYAEADPTADVEGYDAARKIAILATIAFHSRVTFRDVYTEGITKITSKDISYAKTLGRVIKLIALAKPKDGPSDADSGRSSACFCQRFLQRGLCGRRCGGRCDVLRQGCRGDADSECGHGRCFFRRAPDCRAYPGGNQG